MLYDKGLEKHEVNDLGNLWILPRNLNRNKSAKHPKEYLSKVEKGFLRTACIDLKKLDFRTFKTFVANRRIAITKKLREVTGIEANELTELKERLASD